MRRSYVLILIIAGALTRSAIGSLHDGISQDIDAAQTANDNTGDASTSLLRLMQSRPELVALLKVYVAERMRATGIDVSEESISTAMVYDRIRGDSSFAEGATRWLLALTRETTQALQSPAPAGNTTLSGVANFPGTGTEKPVQAQTPPSAYAANRSGGLPTAEASLQGSVSDTRSELPTADSSSQSASAVRQSTLQSEQSELSFRTLPKHFLQDQQAIWTLPAHLTLKDWAFVVPATFGSAVLIGSDTAIEQHLPNSANTVQMAAHASTAGMLALLGTSGGLYLWGRATHDDKKRETGFLAGEAALDAYVASTATQYITQRERPFTGDGKGSFFYGGNAFPSNTAAVSWAAASVLAHEYPGFLTKIIAYGIAGGVSAGRVIGQKHWTSDAVIGSALGWYIGRQIYRSRSEGPEIDASTWGTFEKSPEQEARNPEYMGTTFVPLDSWIYPAMERLEALGYLPTLVQALKPWARMDCARLVLEAEAQIEDEETSGTGAAEVVDSLRREFTIEIANLEGAPNKGIELESAYLRLTQISGRPLYDSWHFAQTLYNDYGRPYGQGLNFLSGLSTRAEAGPFAFYVRGEFQHSAGMPNYSPQLAQVVASNDPLPANSVNNFDSVNQFRLLDAYVALNLANWEVTAGQQSLWWGSAYGGSLIMSNNAQPMPMLRVGRVSPYQFTGPLAWLGQIKNTFFIGSVKGYTYLRGPYPDFPLIGNGFQTANPQPYVWGDKFALKPTPNLEFGLMLSTVWAGYTRPATLETWLHTWSLNGNNQAVDPGKRYSGFNFSYRIPGVRDWLVLYADGLANDEPSPISYARQSAWNPGIYLPKLPLLPKLDLRVEGLYTNIPNYPGLAPYYNNLHYAMGYRTYNQIIGSWVGREGSAVQAWSTYWFSAQNKVQFGYRRQWNDPSFEQGGGLTDVSANVDWLFRKEIQLSTLAQYERWNFPELQSWAGGTMPQNNFTLAVGITFWPTHGTGMQGTAHQFLGTR